MNMQPLHRALLLMLFTSAGMTACGGGDGGGSTTSVSDFNTGAFLDSPVQGLSYVSDTLTGTTDANGAFQYREGEVVRFYAGDGLLDISLGKAIIAPMDFTLQPPASSTERVNPLRIVQTHDVDGDASNGSVLPDIAAGVGADLDVTGEVSVH